MQLWKPLAVCVCCLLLWTFSAHAGGTPAGTAFTYQGLLTSGGSALNDDVDIKARLYDAETDGTQIGTETELLNVPVTDGVFAIDLDFGSVFTGAQRWLELEVKLSTDLPAAYEILSPRQEIKPTPFALFSLSTGLIPDGSLLGTYSQELQLTNVNNTIAGDGSGLSTISASSISGGTINNALNLTSVSNSFTGDGGGLTGLNWSSLVGLPAGFADGVDNDTIVWSTTSGNAHFNSGNVGIGTSTPEGGLSVTSETQTSTPVGQGVHLGKSGAGAGIEIVSDSTGRPYIDFHQGAATSDYDARIQYWGSGNTLEVQGANTFSVPVLEIRGGADIVEGFDTSDNQTIEPGTVMVIDPDNAGALMQSTGAYDFKVAGVVSGAGGIAPGIHLGQDGVMDGDTKVAMTGRVYVKCSTENGAIRPGDRLTTASLAGHAMKATDSMRSDGAVIGKAMSALDERTGLVLVLVNLQ